jgi:predicted glycoside hydrolase/deacetylase ChbG (UPF0249 family)
MSGGGRLIVNADDFGIAEAVNRGIAEAFDRGIVTSASLMATGEAFVHAAALARERPRLAIGVHLVLTEHRPLLGGPAAATLIGRDGLFASHVGAVARNLLTGGVSLAAVRAEFDAQIGRVRDAGIVVSHLDGHQHVHALPGIAGVVAELAEKHGIRAVRYPAERVRSYMLRGVADPRRLLGQMALALTCALSPLRRLRRCDDFVGFYFGGRLDEANLTQLLASLPTGRVVELMCHPGHADMVPTPKWSYAWAAEFAALTSPRVRSLVAARGLELVSYRDL